MMRARLIVTRSWSQTWMNYWGPEWKMKTNKSTPLMWTEKKKRRCFSSAMRTISPSMSKWLIDVFLTQPLVSKSCREIHKSLSVCVIRKQTKLTNLWLICIINDTREMDVCIDVWGSIQYIYTSPQVHISSLGCFTDDWKILNLSTGFPESPVSESSSQSQNVLPLSQWHTGSHIWPPDVDPRPAEHLQPTQMKAAEGWTVRVVLVMDWLVGRETDQSSAAPSEAPSVTLRRVSAFSSSALRV